MCICNRITNLVLFHFTAKNPSGYFPGERPNFPAWAGHWPCQLSSSYVPQQKNGSNNNIMTIIISVILRSDKSFNCSVLLHTVLCLCDLKMLSFSPLFILGTTIHRLKLNLNFIHLKTYLTLHWCQIHLPSYSSIYWICIQPLCPDCIEWIYLSSWRGLLKLTLLGPNPRVSDSVGLGWAQECAFLTGSQLLLV